MDSIRAHVGTSRVDSLEEADRDFLSGRYSREHTWTFDGGLTLAVLSPRITWGASTGHPSAMEEEPLHHAAHEQCFISNAVKTAIVVERPAPGQSPGPDANRSADLVDKHS